MKKNGFLLISIFLILGAFIPVVMGTVYLVSASRSGSKLILSDLQRSSDLRSSLELLKSELSSSRNEILNGNLPQIKNQYELYSKGKTSAEKFIEKNKFNLKGKYKSSQDNGSISTGEFNIPQGSVVVTAGGRLLQEGIDYIVNYQTGDVQILNEALRNSNIPIEISTESNSFYSQQKRIIYLI